MSFSLTKHNRDCTCSYCGNGYDKPIHYGLNIPDDWNKWNAWYVIKFWPNTYFRWTNHWIKKIGKTIK